MNQSVSCHRAWRPHIFFSPSSVSHVSPFLLLCIPLPSMLHPPNPPRHHRYHQCCHQVWFTVHLPLSRQPFFFGHPAQGFLARTNTFKSRKCSVLLRRPKRGRDDYWGWISRKIHRWQKLSKTDETFVKLCVSTLCQFLKWFVSVIQPWFMLEGSLRVDPYLCWQWVN